MNGPLRRVAVAMFVGFMLLAIDVTYWQVVAADRLRDDQRNSRVLLTRTGRERGLIISADDVVLAHSVGDPTDSQRYLREYPHGDLYAHTVGFSSLLFGDNGIEAAYAEELTSGRDLTVSGIINALLGGDVRARSVQLTMNHSLQQVADQALDGQTGAVVAIDPATGEILAMISSPGFDPNTLIGAGASAAWDDLLEDPEQPLKSRATGESYPPGSTFKAVVATAALETGEAGPDTLFPNTRSIELPDSTATIENFDGSLCGSSDQVSLEESFLRSCNTTFALLGMELGAETVIGAAQNFGFNRPVPLEIPVLTSAIPSADTFKNSLAALAQTSLGERDVQATAFQMALIACAIANDGLLMEPHLVARIFDSDSTLESEIEPTLYAQPLGAGTAVVLQQMMERVVTQGTGTRAQIPNVRVAGKTGTAESANGPPHAWFIGFAPVDRPTIAIAVVVASGGNVGESATGGSVAAPIARDVISAWLTISESDNR